MNAPLQPLAYRVPDAARVIGVGTSTMWRMIAAGKVKTFKIEGRTVIDGDDLRAYVAAQKAAYSG